jgi:flagellar FliL protein
MLIINIAIGAVCAGVFIYTVFIFSKPKVSDNVEFMALKEEQLTKAKFHETVKLDKLIISLKSRHTRLRFLDLLVHLVPFTEDHLVTLESRSIQPVIYDIINQRAGEMSPEELNTVEGKILLENRIKNDINRRLGRPVVRELFFTIFVVQ